MFPRISAITLLALFAWAANSFAQEKGAISKVIVYPAEAIEDMARLSHAEYKEIYPGIDVTAYGLSDAGYYIRYSHEQMLYLFGPTKDVDYVRTQKAILEQVRLSVVLQNPNLSSSKIDIIHFDFADGMRDESGENPYLIREDEKQ